MSFVPGEKHPMTPVAERQPEVQEQYEILRSKIEAIADLVLRINNRIEPILRQVTESSKSPAQQPPGLVPFANSLRDENEKLFDIIASLESILNRVEL